MSKVTANGIQIEYETFGNPTNRPLLLIAGHGSQMIQWDEAFCLDLVKRGHYVIRFDYRDVGLSTKFDTAGVPSLETIGKIMQGEKIKPTYTLDDMSDDAVGLLDALGIRKAHICGISMGGMIAQTIAIRHLGRVLSLISIASTTGNPELALPKPEIIGRYVTSPPAEREAYIEHMLGVYKALAGPGFIFDEEWTRKITAESYDRCFYPQGKVRHTVAVLTHGNRVPALASVNVPALVVHGISDPLFLVDAGTDTAKAIPGAQLMLIEGMGHDLPHGGAWPQIVEAIAAHTLKATL
jgi:pimeloyl-ACP methyl ester carboxylesterase